MPRSLAAAAGLLRQVTGGQRRRSGGLCLLLLPTTPPTTTTNNQRDAKHLLRCFDEPHITEEDIIIPSSFFSALPSRAAYGRLSMKPFLSY